MTIFDRSIFLIPAGASVSKTLGRLIRDLSRSIKALDSLIKALGSLKKALGSLKKALGSLKKALGSLKKALGSSIKALGSSIKALGSSIKALGILTKALGSLVAALSLSNALAVEPMLSERPNIVIIVADDLGYADPSFKGSDIETPSIDEIAASGMVLNRFYTAPLCSPTRAALMTARDPMRLGVAYNVLLPWDNGGIHPRERFMSEAFQEAGYQTAIVGKWHLGHAQQQFTPLARGFDEFYGHLHTDVGYYAPFSMVGGKDFQHNGESIESDGYETFLLADHSSRWIKQRDKDKPFFLYLPFLAPHEPLAAPQSLLDKYADLEDKRRPARSPSGGTGTLARLANLKNTRPKYAAVVDAMDQSIGKVIQTLEDEGVRDNTIILFFSDNGATRMIGRGGGDNAPLRGGKAETYEGGIRTISMVSWPAKIKARSSSNAMITVMDIFPTLAAAAKIQPGNQFELDGINILPTLLENKAVARDSTVFFGSEIPTYGSFNFAAIDGDWKLVQWVEQNQTSTDVRNELFNLADDLGEYSNLAAKYPERVLDLTEQISAWRALHPINGTRARLAAPPGWRAPKDWADYPRQYQSMQDDALSSIAPSQFSEQILDRRLGERGRLIYNCKPNAWFAHLCIDELLP